MDPYGKKGTQIRDEDGRLFATLRRDVFEGEIIELDQFEFHVLVNTKPGAPIPRPIIIASENGFK